MDLPSRTKTTTEEQNPRLVRVTGKYHKMDLATAGLIASYQFFQVFFYEQI